jgi:murein DD-endopeptidase MepM/ murein hydrolase activator NlpD
MLVRPGDRVERGQTIGQIGTTGRVTGPHLHYELLVYGQLTDPLPLLTTARQP